MSRSPKGVSHVDKKFGMVVEKTDFLACSKKPMRSSFQLAWALILPSDQAAVFARNSIHSRRTASRNVSLLKATALFTFSWIAYKISSALGSRLGERSWAASLLGTAGGARAGF